MQMPPIRSMSKASTVAKIGRPMKKLTMCGSYLAFFAGRRGGIARLRRGARGLSARRARASRSAFGRTSAALRSLAGHAGDAAVESRVERSRGRSSRVMYFSSGTSTGLTFCPGRTSWMPSTITFWPGFEPRLEHAQAAVRVDAA